MIRKTLNWLFGDWWKAVKDDRTNSWGVYHPWRPHTWSYGLTKERAKFLAWSYNNDHAPTGNE